MFECYSDKAKRVVFFSRYEATQFGSPAIDTEHLLLGIMHESPDLLRSVAGPDTVERIRERIGQLSPVGEKISTSIDLPFTEAVKDVLNSVQEEADQMGNRTINPEHILMGLLRVDNCIAYRILAELGLTLEAVRQYERNCIVKAAKDIIDSRIKGKSVPTEQFRKVVSDGINEATLLRSMSAKPEHLLLALLRDENSLAAGILREAGLDYDSVRKKLE